MISVPAFSSTASLMAPTDVMTVRLPVLYKLHGRRFNIRCHNEYVHPDLLRQSGTGQVLINYGVHTTETLSLPDHRDASPAAADHEKTHIHERVF